VSLRIQEGVNRIIGVIQMTIETTEGTKGQRGIIMGRELSQTETKEFLSSTGLDKDLLDESSEALEVWGQECNRLVKGFFRHIEDRLEGERYGYRKT
jgi:uncharacterized membrane protein YdbT with pleckstrin-like domain